jgi:hypothetical protein
MGQRNYIMIGSIAIRQGGNLLHQQETRLAELGLPLTT